MRLAFCAAALILSACVLPGAKPAIPVANPITGAQVTTQSLDMPSAMAQPGQPAFAGPVAGQVDASLDAMTAAEAKAKAKPAAADAGAKVQPAAVEPPPEAAVEAAPPQSPEAVKCLKQGGLWAAAGKTGAKTCVKRTKDAGKSCTKETQCEGYCLARSRSCAPIKPMFGCNDILQADGREVTLCLD